MSAGGRHLERLRVAWVDPDAGGRIHFTAAFGYAEVAETALLREVGLVDRLVDYRRRHVAAFRPPSWSLCWLPLHRAAARTPARWRGGQKGKRRPFAVYRTDNAARVRAGYISLGMRAHSRTLQTRIERRACRKTRELLSTSDEGSVEHPSNADAPSTTRSSR